LRVRDVVSPTLGVRCEERSGTTLDRMRVFGIQHLIVTRESVIQGVVSEATLERVDPETPVGDLVTEVPILDCDAPIRDAANLMRDRRVGCVPVVENSAIAGVVTIEKLLELIEYGNLQPARRRK
jgi:acetoin utilization protein AcuB